MLSDALTFCLTEEPTLVLALLEFIKLEEMKRTFWAKERKQTKSQKFKSLCLSKASAGS